MSFTPDTIHLLYVDADSSLSEVAATLEREDERLSVATATSADDALAYLADNHVDCIVSAYDLPGVDGLDFLDSVRTDDTSLPFILFPANGSESLASRAIAAGVTDYLPQHDDASQYTELATRILDAVTDDNAETDNGNKQRLRTIIDSLPHLLYVVDEDGNYRLVNETLAQFHDTTVDDIEGASVADVLGDSHAENFYDDLNEVLDSGTSTRISEVTMADASGEEHVFEPRLLPHECDEMQAVLGIATEITERKAREAQLEALNQTTNDMMAADSQEAVVELGVEAARDVLGLEASAIHLLDEEQGGLAPVAMTDPLRDLIGNPPTFTGADSIAWRVYEDGEMLALDDVHNDPDIHNPDSPVKSEIYLPIDNYGILIAGSPTAKAFDHQDLILGEILVGHIATALEQIEQTEELRNREQELASQNDRLEEFASVVSHDLRNPLNVAQGRLSLAQETGETEHLDAAAGALDRMETLIEDLLTLARTGNEISETETIDLGILVENCWEIVETTEADIEISVEGTIEADRSRLRQLLENLIRNAIDHSDGDVMLTVGRLSDGFYIEDDGPGIPEDIRDEIFDTGYSTSEEGTGFGLSIVSQVADAHGWDVHVTESEAGGARFEITAISFSE